MPKYRHLNSDELHSLEKEFVRFLIINGIDSAEWIKIKKSDTTKAAEITELFSDVVFEKIMRKANYLLKVEKNKIFAFKCNADNIELATIETEDPRYDFTKDGGLLKLKENLPSDLAGYKASKKYKDVREQELFMMIEGGCTVTDSQWFDALSKLL